MIFKVDNVGYNVGTVNVVRKATISRQDNGVTMDGTKHNTPYGTYYDYEITIATRGMQVGEYDELYEVLTAPVEYHEITVPYGQTSITFNAKITVAADSLKSNTTILKKWGQLKFTAEAITPQRQVS